MITIYGNFGVVFQWIEYNSVLETGQERANIRRGIRRPPRVTLLDDVKKKKMLKKFKRGRICLKFCFPSPSSSSDDFRFDGFGNIARARWFGAIADRAGAQRPTAENAGDGYATARRRRETEQNARQ